MALPQTMALSEDALEWVAKAHDIGEPHQILRPTPVWRDRAEAAEHDRRVRADLRRLPLFERAGVLDRDFADSLRCLCRPETAYGAMTHLRGRFRYLLACALGPEAILAVREGGTVTLRQADPRSLPGALVSALPEHPAAKFAPVSVPIEEYAAGRGEAGGADDGAARRMWDELAARPQLGGGQVVLDLRDPVGRTRCSEEPLCFVDTDVGGWYYRTEYRGTRRYLFCAPASRHELTRQVHGLYERLAPAESSYAGRASAP